MERACVASARLTNHVFYAGVLLPSEDGMAYAFDAENKKRAAAGAVKRRAIWHRQLLVDRHAPLREVAELEEEALLMDARRVNGSNKQIMVCVWHRSSAIVRVFSAETWAVEKEFTIDASGHGAPSLATAKNRAWTDGQSARVVWSSGDDRTTIIDQNGTATERSGGLFPWIRENGVIKMFLASDQKEVQVLDACLDAENEIFFLVYLRNEKILRIVDKDNKYIENASSIADGPCQSATICALEQFDSFMVAVTYASGTRVMQCGRDVPTRLYTFSTKSDAPKIPRTGCACFVNVTWAVLPRLFVAKTMTLTLYSVEFATARLQWRKPSSAKGATPTESESAMASPMLLALHRCWERLGMAGTFGQAMSEAIAPSFPHICVPRTPEQQRALVFRALYMNMWMNIVAATPARNTLAPVGYVITLTPNYLLQLLENGSERYRAVKDALVRNDASTRTDVLLAMGDASEDPGMLGRVILSQAECDAASMAARATERGGDTADIERAVEPVPKGDPFFEGMARIVAAGTAAQAGAPLNTLVPTATDQTAEVPEGLGKEAIPVKQMAGDRKCVVGKTKRPFVFSCNYETRDVVAVNSAKTLAGQKRQTLPFRGMLATEKFDGVRAQWNPVLECFEIGKAHTARTKKQVPREWASRFGMNRKNAPLFLDGELWAGRGNFYRTMPTIQSTLDWPGIMYVVFDSQDAAVANLDYVDRLQIIRKCVGAVSRDIMHVVEAREMRTKDDAIAMLRAVTRINGEGVVLRTPWAGVADDPLYKLKVQHEMDVTTIASVKEFKGGTHTCTAQNIQHTGIIVMGVPDAYKQGARITIAYNGFGSKGGVLHARFERATQAS